MKRVIKSSVEIESRFGYREPLYEEYRDWSMMYRDSGGHLWHVNNRDTAISEFLETGMTLVEYHTDDLAGDYRLYMDDCGRVWNEYYDGIL